MQSVGCRALQLHKKLLPNIEPMKYHKPTKSISASCGGYFNGALSCSIEKKSFLPRKLHSGQVRRFRKYKN